MEKQTNDWGLISENWDLILVDFKKLTAQDLEKASEAQTRFAIIDRIIRNVLGWNYGQIKVEERCIGQSGDKYVDYILRAGDVTIVIEAKKIGSSFPNPTKKNKLKLTGSLIGNGEISEAIKQAIEYSKNKSAQITVVTNGRCWCAMLTYQYLNREEEGFANLLFPFDDNQDIEKLFYFLSNVSITKSGTSLFTNEAEVINDNKLLTIVPDSETRVDRNNVADFLAPALDGALYSDAFLNSSEYLQKCYVLTSARMKFDKTLEMHLVDSKPISVQPAKRIKVGKGGGTIEKIVSDGKISFAPPVTLVIAPVGVGKSTYLKHFELVYGKDILEKKKAHWIYVDFYSMGREKKVRDFIYEKLRDYIQNCKKDISTDFESAIEPAYKNDIDSLKKGPLALLPKDGTEIKKRITDHIMKDYEQVEPYVDKILGYISSKELCVLVLDNIDLYEDDELERTVLSEGLALSKRIFCNVIISIRDTTFVKHKDDSLFNAFELRKLWLDPPPFKEVLSKRLALSKKILEGQHVKIPFSKGIVLDVPNLGVFFDIVRKSVLSGKAGDFVEAMAGLDIRQGLSYIRNFLMSGHIHADKALKMTLQSFDYDFPFHEVFKGSILGMWKYYKENRTKCLNIFDSKLSAKKLRLMRLYILAFLYINSKSDKTVEVEVKTCLDIFSKLGANTDQIISVINDLKRYNLLKSTDAKPITIDSVVYLTRTGGYYYKVLITKFPYIEACLYDTTIDDSAIWKSLQSLTYGIEAEKDTLTKMKLREKRIVIFAENIKNIEENDNKLLKGNLFMNNCERISKELSNEIRGIFLSLKKYYPTDK